MVVEYIAVGTELLLGNIMNSNARFLGEEFSKLGFTANYQTTVCDNKVSIIEALRIAAERSDVVVLSGGLGVTYDDNTHESVKDFISWQENVGEEIKLKNEFGKSDGMIYPIGDLAVIVLPGNPLELKEMFFKKVVPYLKSISDSKVVTKTVKLTGIGEKELSDKLIGITKANSNPFIVICPKFGEIHLHVTAKADTDKECERLIKPVIRELKNLVGDYIFTTEDEVTLEQSVVDLLMKNNLTVCTAESCTGGMIAARLINVPGVSSVLKNGFVTYSDQEKHKMLGVKNSTLAKYTAVSAEVCREMAIASGVSSKADVIVSVTGYAGPTYEGEAEVGLVYIGCNVKGNVTVKEYVFKGDRQSIRECATTSALDLMRKCIIGYVTANEFGMRGN